MRTSAKIILALLFSFHLAELFELYTFKHSSYEDYAAKVSEVLPGGKTIFCTDNLWLGLHEKGHVIPAHRYFSELATLYPHLSFQQFAREHSIQYIVADKELISWPWFQKSLPQFLQEHAVLLSTVKDDYYNFSDYLSKRSKEPLVTRIYEVVK